MRTIDQLRNAFIHLEIEPTKWLGDSPQRFDTYTRYAAMVESVTEFGVYTGLSTAAFLRGNPRRLRSYDITDQYLTVLPELYNHAQSHGGDFEFAIGNSLEITIDPVDLLFIDTVHKRKHTQQELDKHAHNVKRFIIFHDTAAWPGVYKAACDFMRVNPQWSIVEQCNIDSGLLVIGRQT